jgi:hypothetical protein
MNPVAAINGFCWAASSMNLTAFCATLGWEADDYAEDKFREFQQAARLLGRFDNASVTALIEAGLATNRQPVQPN